MRLLRKGKHKFKSRTRKETCYRCDAKMQYTDDDIQGDRDGNYIVCPECKSFIGVDKSIIGSDKLGGEK